MGRDDTLSREGTLGQHMQLYIFPEKRETRRQKNMKYFNVFLLGERVETLKAFFFEKRKHIYLLFLSDLI
jgi:hypothetical protein